MSEPVPPPPDALRCSARGCKAQAAVVLLWNNPRIHPPERRKSWLACPEHEDPLRQFLAARGFWRETEPVSAADG